MTGYEYFMSLHEVCQFQTREKRKTGVASNGEIKRNCNNSVLRINGNVIRADDLVPFPIKSVTLWSKENRVTIL